MFVVILSFECLVGQNTLWLSSLCHLFHAAITSAVLGLYILMSTLFSKTSCFLHSALRIMFCFHTEQQVKLWVCIISILRSFFLIPKPTRCTNFSNLYWNEILRVSDSSSVHHQEFFTVHTAMVRVYVIQVC